MSAGARQNAYKNNAFDHFKSKVFTFHPCFLCCRFRPSVPVEYVQSSLAFPDLDSCLAFLTGLGVTLTPSDPSKIDCKVSSASLTTS